MPDAFRVNEQMRNCFVFGNDTQRDIARPTPLDGETIYNQSRAAWQVYDGAQWVTVGPSRPVYHGQLLGRLNNLTDYAPTATYGMPRPETLRSLTGSQSYYVRPSQAHADRPILLRHTFTAPVDLTGCNLLFRWHPVGYATIATGAVRLETDASNYYAWTWNKSEHSPLYDGWSQSRVLSLTDFAGTGAPNIASVASIRLSVSTSSGGGNVHDTIFDLACVHDDHHPAVLVLTTDDNLDWNIDTAAAILTANGMAATAYVITGRVGNTSYMTLSDMQTLEAAGWEMANHTNSHTDQTTLSAAACYADIKAGRDWLIANGFTTGADFLAWPFSAMNLTTLAEAKKLCRAARQGTGTTDFAAPVPPTFDQTYKQASYSCDALSDGDFEALVDAVVARKAHGALYYHTKSSAGFTANIEYLKTKVDAGTLVVMTMSEYYEWLTRRFAGNWYTDQSTLFA